MIVPVTHEASGRDAGREGGGKTTNFQPPSPLSPLGMFLKPGGTVPVLAWLLCRCDLIVSFPPSSQAHRSVNPVGLTVCAATAFRAPISPEKGGRREGKLVCNTVRYPCTSGYFCKPVGGCHIEPQRAEKMGFSLSRSSLSGRAPKPSVAVRYKARRRRRQTDLTFWVASYTPGETSASYRLQALALPPRQKD